MQELVGRLTALDPEASESLKVIAYFDALVAGHASSEVLLRGAAVLSGCAAGYISNGSSGRVDASGARTEPQPVGAWPSHPIDDDGLAWIERTGSPLANDAMVLERLAIAIGILQERSAPAVATRKAVEALIDEGASRTERLEALHRLRLNAKGYYRVVAEPASTPVTLQAHAAIIVTPCGPVRASIILADTSGVELAGGRAGIGSRANGAELSASWSTALIALRLTGPKSMRLCADDLGSLLMLAEAMDDSAGEPLDVSNVRRLVATSPHLLATIESIVSTDSIRAAAADAGIHHSTMQAKEAELSSALGFDIRTTAGRTRLSLALSLYRLATNVFE